MKLSDQALTIIKEAAVRRKLADALDCTDQTIVRYIKDNETNGDLTKAASLKVIREESGLPIEEILEESKQEEKVGTGR